MEKKKKSLGVCLRVAFLGRTRIGLVFSSLISFRGTCIQYSSIMTPSAHCKPLTHMVPALIRE